MLPSETMIWQPEFTDKTLSRKPGAVQPSRMSKYKNSFGIMINIIMLAHFMPVIKKQQILFCYFLNEDIMLIVKI
ncbi:hypothetical protein E0K84_24995 [Escherichia coli]|nr:hypothetical protein E0K84_24995 [Escherichia coli]